eukprot:1509753-Amphidinium_carterae.1
MPITQRNRRIASPNMEWCAGSLTLGMTVGPECNTVPHPALKRPCSPDFIQQNPRAWGVFALFSLRLSSCSGHHSARS